MMEDQVYKITAEKLNYSSNQRSGYDLPLIGKAEGHFIELHVTALVCIFLSLLSAVAVIVKSFSGKEQRAKTFFLWNKSERFVVYLALCDGLFNICHSMDHLDLLIRQNQSKPSKTPLLLCQFYAFMLIEFCFAQILMVNIVAINAFVLIFFKRNIDFGKCDWRLLLWMFGVPFCIGSISLGFDKLGPNGAYCFYDGVKGKTTELITTTIPLATIMLSNSALYFITWYKLRKEEPRFDPPSGGSGRKSSVGRGSRRAVKNMTMFVLAFILQWLPLVLYGIWVKSSAIAPLPLFHCVTFFSNIGGVLNGIIFVIIRRQRFQQRRSNGSKRSNLAIVGHINTPVNKM